MTIGQACAPTPDALLAAAIDRAATLASRVDYNVVKALKDSSTAFSGTLTNYYKPNGGNPIRKPLNVRDILNALIDARADVEDAGYRSPSCLLVSKAALKALSYLDRWSARHRVAAHRGEHQLAAPRRVDEDGPPLIDIDYRGVRKI